MHDQCRANDQLSLGWGWGSTSSSVTRNEQHSNKHHCQPWEACKMGLSQAKGLASPENHSSCAFLVRNTHGRDKRQGGGRTRRHTCQLLHKADLSPLSHSRRQANGTSSGIKSLASPKTNPPTQKAVAHHGPNTGSTAWVNYWACMSTSEACQPVTPIHTPCPLLDLWHLVE